jgi:hypothetical protein
MGLKKERRSWQGIVNKTRSPRRRDRILKSIIAICGQPLAHSARLE